DPHGRAVGQYVQVDREGAEGAGHEDLAVGEVDELDDAIDHRVADGDQPVHGSQEQAVDQLLRQFVHRKSSETFGCSTGLPDVGMRVRAGRLWNSAPRGSVVMRVWVSHRCRYRT